MVKRLSKHSTHSIDLVSNTHNHHHGVIGDHLDGCRLTAYTQPTLPSFNVSGRPFVRRERQYGRASKVAVDVVSIDWSPRRRPEALLQARVLKIERHIEILTDVIASVVGISLVSGHGLDGKWLSEGEDWARL